MPSARGSLAWHPLADHLALVAEPVAAAAALVPHAEVAEIGREPRHRPAPLRDHCGYRIVGPRILPRWCREVRRRDRS